MTGMEINSNNKEQGKGHMGSFRFWRCPVAWGGILCVGLLVYGLCWYFLPSITFPRSLGGLLFIAGLAGLFWSLGRRQAKDPLAKLIKVSADHNPDGRMITNADGDVLYQNKAVETLFGGPFPRLEELTGLLRQSEDADDEIMRLAANARGGIAGHGVFPLQTDKGGRHWFRLSTVPLKDKEGHALWRIQDVTAHHDVEVIKRAENKMLADFVESLPIGFFSVDGEGRIIYANDQLCRWLDTSVTTMRTDKMSFADFVVQDESAASPRTTDNDIFYGDITLRPKEGDSFKATLIQSALFDENGDAQYTRSVVLRDMVWTDDAVGASGGDNDIAEDLPVQWMFDDAPVGIVLVDLDGLITDCNRAFSKLLGLHRDVIVDKSFAECVSAEDRADVAAQLSKIVMGAARAAHLEVRMPATRDRELVISLYASRRVGLDGDMVGLVLYFIDNTEQRHLEVQFGQSQKMQAVGQLAGGVAHDFNNLLTAMIGFCDLLLSRHGPDDPDFADIQQIKQNANRATNLVRQLLAFSRQQKLAPVNFDPDEALSDLSNLLGRLIGEKVQLTIKHGEDVGLIRTDKGQFDQIIINLVVNARDAMPGGGSVTVSTECQVLTEALQKGHEVIPAGAYVLIKVTDTGAGIAKEDIGRIFEPFFSTKDVGAGTGLGLSTVYGIIHQSDGFIFVNSAMGEGTTFSIYLPRYHPATAMDFANEEEPIGQQAELQLVEPDLTGDGTILLVEDEDAVRMVGARSLRNKGYTVLEAGNGEEALDVINDTDQKIDLIVTDIAMPGMDGHTMVRLVRQEMPTVKVILMSGYAEDIYLEEIEKDETLHFLPKPFSLKDLNLKVKSLMDE